ncbi:MAG: XdhC family protein [Rhizobiaceae bacterium]
MIAKPDILELASELKAEGEMFALATVVRTVSVTAAKAGARALIRSDGVVSDGWIGGGCAKSAVVKAARESMAGGQPQLISIQPEHLLDEQGVVAGAELEGVRFAANHCPSKGTMDIFIEPVLPKPELVIFGSSPVAIALSELAPSLGYYCTVCVKDDQRHQFIGVDQVLDGYSKQNTRDRQRFIVISTQGKGDEEAVQQALDLPSTFISFVGSKAKAMSLRQKFMEAGSNLDVFDKIKVPAGLDLGAITPEEIALSILAEITTIRRKGHRTDIMDASIKTGVAQ